MKRLNWRQRAMLQVLLVGSIVTGLAIWGQQLHHGQPKWFTDTPLTKPQTVSLLSASIAGLKSASIDMASSGKSELSAHAAVSFRHPYVDGQMVISGLTPAPANVTLCRSAAYVSSTDFTDVLVRLSDRSQGYRQTVLSQISAVIDLPTMFAAVGKAVLQTTYVGREKVHERAVDHFRLVVAAARIRALLPPRLTQNSDNIRRTVPVEVWLDTSGKLVSFATVINGNWSTFDVSAAKPQTCPAQFQTKVATEPAAKV